MQKLFGFIIGCLLIVSVAFAASRAKFGTVIVETIQNEAGDAPPGMVPIGGMVAVMPNVTGAWQPPASGAIKDGFMRADGSTVSDSGSPLNGQALPNMTGGVYPRGNTTSGGTGGSNTHTPTGTVSQPTFTGSATSYTVSVPSHYHGFSLTAAGQSYSGNSASVSSTAHTHNSSTVTINKNQWNTNQTAHGHTLNRYDYAYEGVTGRAGVAAGRSGATLTTDTSVTNTAAWASVNATGTAAGQGGGSHSHTVSLNHTHLASSVSGSVGNTGGSNGNGAFNASGTNTPSGTVSQPTFTGNSQNTEPSYVNVVWVVRVK